MGAAFVWSRRPRRFLNAPDITTTQGLRDQTKAAPIVRTRWKVADLERRWRWTALVAERTRTAIPIR
jgi:hypothetical protein